jgi:hypothetical protein
MFEPEQKGTFMRTYILIAALILGTSAHATERGLVIPPASPVEAPVILSAEQLAAQQSQQAPAQPAAPVAQQPVAQQQPTQAINGTQQTMTQQELAAQQQQLAAEKQQLAAQQQQLAAQQQAMRQQQMQQMQQQRMMQQRMAMARNMTPEQKLAYKVHEVKTKLKVKLVHAILR